MTTEKILVVEDEISLQETLIYTLSNQGYDVHAVGDGKTALDAARRYCPDLILLDLMLPVLDGFEVCRILRREMSVPILMLTARDGEIDRVLGLEMGADDYLTKPFSMRELLARVKALLRRVKLDLGDMPLNGVAPQKGTIDFGNFRMDFSRRELTRAGEMVSLKPKEFNLLAFLASHNGQVLTREVLLDRVWGWDFRGGSRTVDVHVRWLREKIEADPSNPRHLITVRGIGYRFDG
jgi:DNA-binding response OmpR family regulator